MPDLLIAIGGAATGALLTFAFDVRKERGERAARALEEQRERRRKRTTIATALLFDMRLLEGVLRQVFESSSPTSMAVHSPTLFYKSLYPEMRALAPETIQPVADFFNRVEHLVGAYTVLRAVNDGQLRPTPERTYELRCHAAFALQLLPAAIEALEAEGGIRPVSATHRTVSMPTLPEIPPRQLSDELEG